jgi:translation initiation factor eIF-2B subunit epsilon
MPDLTSETLKAIVITDSFNRRFLPVTLHHPRALLPVANVPLLEYTLEFLSASGVKEVFYLFIKFS